VGVLVRAADPEGEVAVHPAAGAGDLVGEGGLAGGLRIGVRHLEDGRDAAHHGRPRAGLKVLLVGRAGLAEMHLRVDDAWQDVQAPAVHHLAGGGGRQVADRRDGVLADADVPLRPSVLVDDGSALENAVEGLGHGALRGCGRALEVSAGAAYVTRAARATGAGMPTAHLTDRGIVRVSGADARPFLDGLVTCDVDRVTASVARLGALLTPQGKILFDFILMQAPEDAGGGYLLDVQQPFAPDLAKRLAFYRLRAKVAIEDRSQALAVVAGFGDAPRPADEVGVVVEDPRLPPLGWRAVVAAEDAAELADAGSDAYAAHRIALGVPEGGRDFLFGDAFPHEALMDQLGGVDFDKGCYVGQEVVSRMEHRGTARTRIVPVIYPEGPVPEAGAEVRAGETVLGKTGTAAAGRGLATIRLDRAADALAAGTPITAGGLPVRLAKPDWIRFPFPGEPATQA
jgi:folate-binding protein YgfZ